MMISCVTDEYISSNILGRNGDEPTPEEDLRLFDLLDLAYVLRNSRNRQSPRNSSETGSAGDILAANLQLTGSGHVFWTLGVSMKVISSREMDIRVDALAASLDILNQIRLVVK
jgi:hypothetical protein